MEESKQTNHEEGNPRQEHPRLRLLGPNSRSIRSHGQWNWNLNDGTIRVSPRCRTLLGEPRRGSLTDSDTWMRCLHPGDREPLMRAMNRCRSGESCVLDLKVRVLRPDGSIRLIGMRGSVMAKFGRATHITGMCVDLDEGRERGAIESESGLHDELTGMANRTLLKEQLRRRMHQSRQQAKPGFAVLFLDLDGFKQINDTHGHQVGDEILRALAQRLRSETRHMDTVARLGGDEFALLLHDVDGSKEALRSADRIREFLSEPYEIDDQEFRLSCSIGIAIPDSRHDNEEDLLHAADLAMYRAKSKGKNRCELFDGRMRDEAREIRRRRIELRRALRRDEFRLQYQPILSLDRDRVIGFEGLIRWKHPRKGLLKPAHFLDLAEETGLGVPIGSWVMREGCRHLALWQSRSETGDAPTLSLNLSPSQLDHPDFLEELDHALRESAADPHGLKLEIPEAVLMRSSSQLQQILSEIRRRNIQIQVDGFGTGYSSIRRLHDCRVRTLKVDQSFIDGIERSSDLQKIVRAIIQLAKSLRMEVIAEGVESRQQVDCLRVLGCDQAQGFHFSEPLDSIEAEHYLS